MNRDFKDLLSEFSAKGVEFLIVGAHALAAHGHVRATTGITFQIGVEPVRIDIITEIDGVTFDAAWARREMKTLDGLSLGVLSRQDLIANKKATGRLQDLADVEVLEKLTR